MALVDWNSHLKKNCTYGNLQFKILVYSNSIRGTLRANVVTSIAVLFTRIMLVRMCHPSLLTFKTGRAVFQLKLAYFPRFFRSENNVKFNSYMLYYNSLSRAPFLL